MLQHQSILINFSRKLPDTKAMFASRRLLTLPVKYVDLKIRKQTGVETRCVKRSIIFYVPPVAQPEIIFSRRIILKFADDFRQGHKVNVTVTREKLVFAFQPKIFKLRRRLLKYTFKLGKSGKIFWSIKPWKNKMFLGGKSNMIFIRTSYILHCIMIKHKLIWYYQRSISEENIFGDVPKNVIIVKASLWNVRLFICAVCYFKAA